MALSTTTKYILRASFAGIVAAAASLQASAPLSWDDAGQAFIAGVLAVGLYLGLGAATPIEPNVGKKST